jgi:hypothetical protein
MPTETILGFAQNLERRVPWTAELNPSVIALINTEHREVLLANLVVQRSTQSLGNLRRHQVKHVASRHGTENASRNLPVVAPNVAPVDFLTKAVLRKPS